MQSFSTPRWIEEPVQKGTSPSYTAHIIAVPILLAIFSRQQRQTHLLPTGPHEPRCSDFVGHPGFVRHSATSEGEAQYLGFRGSYFGDHGTTPRPIDATIEDCAVHMIVDSLTLVFQVYCLGAVDALVTPPPLHRLVHGALGWTKTTNKEGTMLVYSVFVMYILSHVKKLNELTISATCPDAVSVE